MPKNELILEGRIICFSNRTGSSACWGPSPLSKSVSSYPACLLPDVLIPIPGLTSREKLVLLFIYTSISDISLYSVHY